MQTRLLLIIPVIFSPFIIVNKQDKEHVEYKIVQNDSMLVFLREKTDPNNNTIWYQADIETEVCRERLCEIAHITIYWDEIGDFLKFTLPEGKDLTKYDHKPFNADDYRKLANILADSTSLLKNLSYNEINDVIERAQKEVDAVTGATPGELANAVVRDAALSTYTFWHIVYGASRDTIRNHLEQKMSINYVLNKLENGKPNTKLWAIKTAKEKYGDNEQARQQILELISDDNFDVAATSLRFFTDDELETQYVQQEIIRLFPQVQGVMKFEILYCLKKLKKIYPETFTFLLNEFIENKIGVSAYNHIIEIGELVEAPNEQDLVAMERLLYHDNFYVARKAYDYLKEQAMRDKQLSKDLRKFEKRYSERLN